MGTIAIFQSRAKARRERAAESERPVARRRPGRRVSFDLAVALTSQELASCTRSKEVVPGGCIAVSPAGVTLAMGERAREMEGRVPVHVRVLQPLQGGRVVDSNLAVRLFENIFKTTGQRGPVGPRVLLQAPSNLTDAERKNLIEAARSAGARSVQLVAQSLVAAVGADMPVLEPTGSLVVDLDGTAAELSLISYGRVLETRSLTASRQLCETAVSDLVRRELHVQISMGTAEALLREIGSAERTSSEQTMAIGGRDLVEGLPRKVEVSSDLVFRAIQPALDQLARELHTLLAEIPGELLADIVRTGVVLTGAGARLNGLESYLSRRLNVKVRLAPEAEQAGIQGLHRLLREDGLRRALIGAPHKMTAPSLRVSSPGRIAAAAVLFLGLLGAFVPLAGQASAGAQSVDSAFQSGLAPFWKAASSGSENIGPPVPDSIKAEQRRRQQSLAEENSRLRSLLKLKAAPFSKGKMRAARVIARDPQGWLSWVVLDAGSAEGIKQGMPVVAPEGLLGTVSSVNKNSSRVRLLTHPNSAIAATIKNRKANGVLYGRNQKACELRFVDPEKVVKPGDLVTTSGLDGRYPAGLTLGRVLQVKAPQDNVYSSVLVAPANASSSTAVLLLGK